MAHPYVQVHGKDWQTILNYLKDLISFIALHSSESDDSVRQMVDNYVDLIERNKREIFVATAHEIVKYLNFYNVTPTEGVHDEFKSIYFTGVVVSRFLLRDGLNHVNRYHLLSVLRLLDVRLAIPQKAHRPVLTQRIKKSISHDKLDDDLGQYGWYLLYKCLFNAANENSKTL